MLSFGPYETLSRIAAGGMGEVFVARRTGAGDFEKKVALKVMLPHLAHDREFVERFFDEARLVARMNHPNIVQIFDVGETDGRPWLAMALVEAVSLARLIHALGERRDSLSLPLVRLIATGLLEGLAYAHALKGPKGEALNVVHRDITPSNLLVSTDGAVLLTDFGIAKAAINLHQTRPGKLRGKLAYLAPEMLSTEAVDRRADLFSAAVTLYQLLSGVSVFLKDTDAETMDAVKAAKVPPVQSVRADVTPGMAAALERALQRQAAARFASAREMREAFCDGPVASAPELGEAVKRWCGKGLASFKEGTSGPSTSSLPDQVTDKVPRRRWPVAVVVAVAIGIGGAALYSTLPFPEGGEGRGEGPKQEQPSEEENPPRPALAVVEDPTPPKPPPTPRPARPAPKPQPIIAARPSHPPFIEPLRVGYLTADAAPWADVFLDGRVLDRTPLSRFPVPSGSHVVTFKSADGRKLERNVNIGEGEVQVVRVEFPP